MGHAVDYHRFLSEHYASKGLGSVDYDVVGNGTMRQSILVIASLLAVNSLPSSVATVLYYGSRGKGPGPVFGNT